MATPLRAALKKAKMSPTELATAVGVSQPTINRIENGRARPSPELANKIAQRLGNITRDQLLFPEDYTARKAS